MNIYLDIETIPSQHPKAREIIAAAIKAPAQYKKADSIAKWEVEDKPAAVEEAYLRTSFDGSMGHIVCAALALENEPPVKFWNPEWNEPDAESKVLSSLFDAIHVFTGHVTHQPTFIGHNIVDFDLRFIFQRAVILGIRPPAVIPFRAKPWGTDVFDTMTMWAGRDRISMDKLCRSMGIDGKGDEIDGSKVWQFVQDGRIAEVADYCAQDVIRTRAIHRRMTFQAVAA